jgi:hypothetical protein
MEKATVIINGNAFEADLEIAGLLVALNEYGLVTTQHCGGHGVDDAYVSIDIKRSQINDIAVRMIDGYPRLVIWWKLPETETSCGGMDRSGTT